MYFDFLGLKFFVSDLFISLESFCVPFPCHFMRYFFYIFSNFVFGRCPGQLSHITFILLFSWSLLKLCVISFSSCLFNNITPLINHKNLISKSSILITHIIIVAGRTLVIFVRFCLCFLPVCECLFLD
jgi:hypothetical protein